MVGSHCEVIIDDKKRNEVTTDTVPTAPLRFLEADLEAAERLKKEGKNDGMKATWDYSL